MSVTSAPKQEHLVSEKQGYGTTENHVTVDVVDEGNVSKSGFLSKQMSMEQGASVITAHNIRYTVNVRTRPCCGPSNDKEILKGIE